MKEIVLTGRCLSLHKNILKTNTAKVVIPLPDIISALEKEGYVVCRLNKEKNGEIVIKPDLEEVELSPIDRSIADFQDVADNREAIRMLARNQERLARRKG